MDDNYDKLINKINSKQYINLNDTYKKGMLVAVRLREQCDKIVVGEIMDLISINNQLHYKVSIDSTNINIVNVPIYDVTTLNHVDVLWAIAHL
jgi:hypothetical protein|nr:MAG TPA: hypothetical protein [Crassvirales sp.]